MIYFGFEGVLLKIFVGEKWFVGFGGVRRVKGLSENAARRNCF